ncbi:MAG: hypothetical protein JXB23_10850 [Candidatus Aminicenantes bacterium]|nr:hypothetical protein [Candidatus Aminicenantes bacterium]
MDGNSLDKLSSEEKVRIIQEASEELNKFLTEDYHRIKDILSKNSSQKEADFTLTVGIQNAYLG